MLSRLKNLNFTDENAPWFISATLHCLLLAFALILIYGTTRRPVSKVDIEVIEAPKVAPKAIEFTQPKEPPKRPKQHEVFGITRKAVTSTEGDVVKAGNTIAKTPDQETLKPGDQDALPIPSEDYLVTRMPELKSDVRIPYPPASKKLGIQGPVIMDMLIDSSGKVREVKLVEGPNSELSAAAVSAAQDFRFTPALIQDKAVAVRIRYIYRFILEQ